tara:strand:+ start:308 stop:478 length:171 start_codon:yes stop_codon:yes gene_type:complete
MQEIAQVVVSQWPTSKLEEVQATVLKKHDFESLPELDACALEFMSYPHYALGVQKQ